MCYGLKHGAIDSRYDVQYTSMPLQLMMHTSLRDVRHVLHEVDGIHLHVLCVQVPVFCVTLCARVYCAPFICIHVGLKP